MFWNLTLKEIQCSLDIFLRRLKSECANLVKWAFKIGMTRSLFFCWALQSHQNSCTFCPENCQEPINKHKIIQDQEKNVMPAVNAVVFNCVVFFFSQCILFSACLWGLPRYSATFLSMTHVCMLPQLAIFSYEYLKGCWCLPGASLC